MFNNRMRPPFRPRAPVRPTTVEDRSIPPIPAIRYDPGDVGSRYPHEAHSQREFQDNQVAMRLYHPGMSLLHRDALELDSLTEMFRTAESDPLVIYMATDFLDQRLYDPRTDQREAEDYTHNVLLRLGQLVAAGDIVATEEPSFDFENFYDKVWHLAFAAVQLFATMDTSQHQIENAVNTVLHAAESNRRAVFEERILTQYRSPEERRYKQDSLLMLVQLVAAAALYASVNPTFELEDFVSKAWNVADEILEFF